MVYSNHLLPFHYKKYTHFFKLYREGVSPYHTLFCFDFMFLLLNISLAERSLDAARQLSQSHVCHSESFDRLRTGSAKNLINPCTYTFEILRLPPQNDGVGQPPWGNFDWEVIISF